MNNDAVKPKGERLSRKDWLNTRCSVPNHHHWGPTAECHKLMAELAAPNVKQCFHCNRVVADVEPCPVCGYVAPRLKRSDPEYLRRLFGIGDPPLGRWQADGKGCVERTSLAERVWNGGGE